MILLYTVDYFKNICPKTEWQNILFNWRLIRPGFIPSCHRYLDVHQSTELGFYSFKEDYGDIIEMPMMFYLKHCKSYSDSDFSSRKGSWEPSCLEKEAEIFPHILSLSSGSRNRTRSGRIRRSWKPSSIKHHGRKEERL